MFFLKNLARKRLMTSHSLCGVITAMYNYYPGPEFSVVANFKRRKNININLYLHFMSFLHTNKTQVVEIPPRVRQGPTYST